MIANLYRKGECLYMADFCSPETPIGDIIMDDEGIKMRDRSMSFYDGIPQKATAQELKTFLGLVNGAGLVFYDDRYHAIPCKEDQEILGRAMNMKSYDWPRKASLISQCRGTYAKAYIRRMCINDNHREEAINGDL